MKLNWRVGMLLVLALIIAATSAYAAQTTDSSYKKQKVKIKLPKKPEIWEVYKNLDKEKYRAQVNFTEGNSDSSAQGGAAEFQSFLGFAGSYATDEVEGDQVKLLEETLTVSTNGVWRALGLVRNETVADVGDIKIEANLYSIDGGLLEKVQTDALVERIRPGEPVPFEIDATTPAGMVSKVEWKVFAKKANKQASRDQVIRMFYELAYGQSDYKGLAREGSAFPYEMAAGFNNLGQEVKKEKLIAAWLTPEGKIFHIETAQMNAAFANGIPEGGMANFDHIMVSDPQVAPKLSEYEYMLWVVGE